MSAVRELRIDRPERRNALDGATIARLRRELEAAAADAELRALVLHGGGVQSFCAGQDVNVILSCLTRHWNR